MQVQLCLSLGELRQSFVIVNLQHFFFSFLHGKFFFFVAVRAMSRVAAALAARFVVPYFFWLTRFVIYISSYCSAHFLVYCNYIGDLVQVSFIGYLHFKLHEAHANRVKLTLSSPVSRSEFALILTQSQWHPICYFIV